MSKLIVLLHARLVTATRWRDDTGSVTVEYGGLIVVVVTIALAVIGIVTKTDLLAKLFNAVMDNSIKELVK
jgi:Flp pilus assembly pilin Flp